jgi:hypothetical protein
MAVGARPAASVAMTPAASAPACMPCMQARQRPAEGPVVVAAGLAVAASVPVPGGI